MNAQNDNGKLRTRKTMRRAYKKQGRIQQNLKWLVPIAVMLIVLITLFSIPSTSRAIQNWLNDIFRIEKYMRQENQNATPNPDIEEVITEIDPYNQSYEILLLDEIPATDSYSYPSIDEWRVKLGQKSFERADWAWITDIKPHVEEVLYDGKNLIISTFYETDPLPFARCYLYRDGGTPMCDLLNLEYRLTVNGKPIAESMSSTGLDFSKWSNGDTSLQTLDEVQQQGGVYGLDTIEFPVSPGLPNGICEVELVQMVTDANVDDMSIVGMVGEVILRFSFDTTKGNEPVSDKVDSEITLHGTAPFLTNDYSDTVKGARTTAVKEVNLDGIRLNPIVNQRNTGIDIELQYDFPAERSDLQAEDVQHSIAFNIGFDLYMDDEYVGRVYAIGSYDHPSVEIAMTPSELSGIRAITLKPIAVLNRHDDEVGTPLTGCDIVIPLH